VTSSAAERARDVLRACRRGEPDIAWKLLESSPDPAATLSAVIATVAGVMNAAHALEDAP
jgi:hypothetical protein